MQPDERTDPATAAQDEVDARAAHQADREPTPDEERDAEEAAETVDPEAGENYRKMAERGANVRGEGQITPE